MKNAATALLLLLLTVTTTAAAADWPQWRGPTGNGVAPDGDPPVTWSETDNVRWKVAVPGSGLGTPIVWKDAIYLTTAIDAGARPDPDAAAKAEAAQSEWRRKSGVAPENLLEFAVLALDRGTGEVRWKKSLRTAAPHEGTHGDATWASASAITDGDTLIAHFGSFGTYALDLDGKLRWERDLGDMATRNAFGEGASPALHGDRVVITWDHEGDSFLAVLDRKTGETVWQKPRDEPTSWATPVVVEVTGKPQIVVPGHTANRGYDLATGEVLWQIDGMTKNVVPSPVIAGGRAFLMSGFRGNALQAIDLAKAEGDLTDSAALAWTHERDTPYVPSPLLDDGRLFFLKSNKAILTAFDAIEGKALFGPVRLEGLKGVYASPVGAAGRIYVVGRNGQTVVAKNAGELEVIATNSLDDRFDASPAIAGDALFLRGRKHLYCLAEAGD